MTGDPRQFAPATDRNRGPILDVLRRVLPARGLVLEVASGTGEHVAYFAQAMPGMAFQPTEYEAERRASVDAWTAGLGNVRAAMPLDATASEWPVSDVTAVFCANMIHIAPWTACAGLMVGAGRVLLPGGVLVLYGPFLREGVPTAPSNVAFDTSLRARDERWGVRDLAAVAALAEGCGLGLDEVVEMPAHNLIVVFRRGQ